MTERERRHFEELRRLGPECTVLLKSNGDFPLDEPGKLALYGGGARNTIKGGTGSGDVNVRSFSSIEKALSATGFIITTGPWLDGYDEVKAKAKEKFLADIRAQAKREHKLAIMASMGKVLTEPEYDLPLDGEGDTAVYVLARNSGEGNDRTTAKGDVRLTDTEVRDILALNGSYRRFMLVLNTGGVVDLSPVMEVGNILLLSQLGVVTGEVLSDILLGVSSPSGHLTTTWGTAEDIEAVEEFGKRDETRYREGIYVGYRYYDTVGKKPLFPFGFGLSYTTFRKSILDVAVEGDDIMVKVEVENTGRIPGKETLMVYVSAPEGKLKKPARTLAGFGKTSLLGPEEKTVVEISFHMEDVASYDEGLSSWILEKGAYILHLDEEAIAAVELPETVVTKALSPIGGKPDFKDFAPDGKPTEMPSGVPCFTMESKVFAEKTRKSAEPSVEAKAFVKDLSDEELCHLVVGEAHMRGGIQSVIGSASTHVAGAAGESVSLKGLEPLVMADGPAGLRLSRDYTRDQKGVHPIGSTLPMDAIDLLPTFVVKLMSGKKPKGEVLHQYCSAIPIGTALAQSWNKDLWEEVGDMVGREMEEYGVDLWLAPAFNLHRSPLCGRNFEYMSEDPLVSGLCAAGITKGVQKHPGKGVTVKHFACNNQETNRYQNSSQVSERALRELYLKSFEICIRESDPVALMTSYNLLNGIHTSERPDLLKTFLREELGWNGLVMSDWVVGLMSSKECKYRNADAAFAVKAGNDLFMPGSKGDYKSVLSALKGKNKEICLSREEVEYCASHLVDAVWRLKGRS